MLHNKLVKRLRAWWERWGHLDDAISLAKSVGWVVGLVSAAIGVSVAALILAIIQSLWWLVALAPIYSAAALWFGFEARSYRRWRTSPPPSAPVVPARPKREEPAADVFGIRCVVDGGALYFAGHRLSNVRLDCPAHKVALKARLAGRLQEPPDSMQVGESAGHLVCVGLQDDDEHEIWPTKETYVQNIKDIAGERLLAIHRGATS